MLSTCGRGGNAQAVRDEILNIMHRNNIGEKRGTWMEARPSLARSNCRCWPRISPLPCAAPTSCSLDWMRCGGRLTLLNPSGNECLMCSLKANKAPKVSFPIWLE